MKRGEQPFGQSVFSYLLWLCRGFPSACGIRKTRTVGRTQPGGSSDFDSGTGRDREGPGLPACQAPAGVFETLVSRLRGSPPLSSRSFSSRICFQVRAGFPRYAIGERGFPRSGSFRAHCVPKWKIRAGPLSGRGSSSTCDTVVVRRGSLEKGDGVVFGDMASSFFRVPPSSPWHFDSHFPYFSASNLAIQVCTSVASCVARSVVNKTIRQSGENAAKTCLCTILTPLRCGPFSARL